MKTSEIRANLAAAHAVHGVAAKVQKIGVGALKGGWKYKKFRPGYMFCGSTWLYAGQTSEVERFLSGHALTPHDTP